MGFKLSIVSAGALPIPACCGGGVETLVQHFIDENEKRKLFDIVVYTVSGAEKLQKKYKHTKFVNITRNTVIDRFARSANRMLYAANRRTTQIASMRIRDSYESRVIQLLEEAHEDVTIFENNLIFLLRKNEICSKVIFHAHYDDVNNSVSQFEKKRFQHCYSSIDANIGVSTFISNRIQEVIGTNKTLYFTVPNCIDVDRFVSVSEYRTAMIREKYAIPGNIPVILYSGRITKEKGVAKLIQAFQRLQTEACLVIVGGIFYSDSTDNSFLREVKYTASQCENPVIFTGYVDYALMPEIWAVADVAVVPTYDVEEAAGLVVIEAMAAGKPIILSDSGAMQEYAGSDCSIVVKRGETFVDELAEKMELLCKNKVIREKMGKSARKQAQKWNASVYYEKMADIIKQIYGSEYD